MLQAPPVTLGKLVLTEVPVFMANPEKWVHPAKTDQLEGKVSKEPSVPWALLACLVLAVLWAARAPRVLLAAKALRAHPAPRVRSDLPVTRGPWVTLVSVVPLDPTVISGSRVFVVPLDLQESAVT